VRGGHVAIPLESFKKFSNDGKTPPTEGSLPGGLVRGLVYYRPSDSDEKTLRPARNPGFVSPSAGRSASARSSVLCLQVLHDFAHPTKPLLAVVVVNEVIANQRPRLIPFDSPRGRFSPCELR